MGLWTFERKIKEKNVAWTWTCFLTVKQDDISVNSSTWLSSYVTYPYKLAPIPSLMDSTLHAPCLSYPSDVTRQRCRGVSRRRWHWKGVLWLSGDFDLLQADSGYLINEKREACTYFRLHIGAQVTHFNVIHLQKPVHRTLWWAQA